MSPEFHTPGVSVDEVPLLPPPITEVATAVVGFVGYTARTVDAAGADLLLTPRRIASLQEFEWTFGGAAPEPLTVDVVTDALVPLGYVVRAYSPATAAPRLTLYWAVKLFFENGGRFCYVVSAGQHGPVVDASALARAVSALAGESDITLVAVPDAASLATRQDYADVVGAILAHCGTRRDRFAIIDVWRGHLEPGTTVDDNGTVIDANRQAWLDHLAYGAAYYPHLVTSVSQLSATPGASISVTLDGAAPQSLEALAAATHGAAVVVRAALGARHLVVPPSGAVAGVYCATDVARGVWKAPANVSLAGVLEPAVSLTSAQQADLEVDPAGGKSINGIREFTGTGTVVWGARTLAGNDNEWRYVPVRRFLIMVEQSVLRSTAWAAFEPNDQRLWTRLRGTIEAYLAQKWRNAALSGTTTTEAFYVRCGLGVTMTQADIDQGRLVVELGLAPVRPAEFIVVRLSFSMQQA